MNLEPDEKHHLLVHLHNIEAVAALIERAFERIEPGAENTGPYGGACLIRREAEAIRKMMGEF